MQKFRSRVGDVMAHMKHEILALLLLLSVLPTIAAQQSTAGGRYDSQIQQKVEEALKSDSKYQGVQATTEDGIVTLTGKVKLYNDKLDAEKRVRRIEHVEGVRNHLEVETTVPDDVLMEHLAKKLRYDRIGFGIMFNSLKLAVKNGVVRVTGDVIDYPSRESALSLVATEPGVKDVIDDIHVLPVSNFDDELRVKVAQAIYGHPSLQRYAIDPQAPIRVVVKSGHVRLDGVVDSDVDRQIAYTQAASVPGVFSVENNLMVASQQKSKDSKKQ
jgi:hyperosmotically inducible periplasmic protein